MNRDYWREMFSYTALYRKMAKVKKLVKPQKVSFGKHRDQYFLHYAPLTAKSDKVVVWIHGGGWNAGNPKDFDFVGQHFAKEGYHCISLGYRLSPKHKYPCQTEDVCAGFVKAKKYLADCGVDTSKIIVTGPSAGAHLAAALCYDRVFQEKYAIDTDCIIGYIGVAGPLSFRKGMTWTVRTLLGQLFAKGYDRSLGEPCSFLQKNIIPMLLIHSRHDGLLDYSMSEDFYEKANALGMECELYDVVDKLDTHSAYSAGMFLETRATNKALDKLFTWIEQA
ncbi:MAG: alpha/beta hydrolase [Ruminococcaceae bacterium]|nr:alpha/beta hydrolase [Oscillospiraceae bacterium]